MKDTRVLITTYQSAFLRPGGGEAELHNLVEVLRQLGISADLYGSTSMTIDAYDVVLHFSVQGESYEFVHSIKKMGKKVILWPNLWWLKTPQETEAAFVESFLEMADVVIFKSMSELSNVSNYISLNNTKYEIVPWHIDKEYLEPAQPDYFRKLYGLNEYILWVGVIEEGKNQLAAINSLYDYHIPLVFIGSQRDKKYFDECRNSAPDDALFLPFMRQGSDVLRSAYMGCSVYMELSSDPAGLSSLEAALYEKPMVLSKNTWSIEEFGDDVALVDPESKSEITQAIKECVAGKHVFKGKHRIIKKHLMPESLNTLVSLINGSSTGG